jgi:SAM-dependent methyltransferase
MLKDSTSAQSYFGARFTPDTQRDALWQPLCEYLQRYIPVTGRVLDLGAGYCSFINQIQASEKHALDLYPDFIQYATPDVHTHVGSCEDLGQFSTGYFDAVFASNLLEHLARETLARTLDETRRVLRPGGRLLLIQPNFRYSYREYFDDYTHVQVFTDVSLADLVRAHGFAVERVEARFLPFSLKSRLPKWPGLVRLYLRLPVRPLAKQMLVVARA